MIVLIKYHTFFKIKYFNWIL